MSTIGERGWWIASVVAAATMTTACSAILGFQDAVDMRDSGIDSSAAEDAGDASSGDARPAEASAEATSEAAGGDAGEDVTTVEAAADAPTADAPEETSTDAAPDAQTEAGVPDAGDPCDSAVADPSVGVFVSPSGNDAPNCGAQATPCASLQVAINEAAASGKAVVYVAPATYAESITLPAGITLVGGWTSQWTKQDDGGAGLATVAPAAGNVTMTADSIGGSARLCTLTVGSRPAASVQPGETIYGVFARGSTTSLELDGVVVLVAPGGAGANGAAGATGVAGASGGCATAGDGGVGILAGDAGAPAAAGAFASQGFVPATGGIGAPGSAGSNGSPGTPGCISCITCGGLFCSSSSAGTSCGAAGVPGCAGQGGLGGNPGASGGSSVAVFAWGATLTMHDCTLTAANGGPGGAGGDGGAGGVGTAGVVGDAGKTCGFGSCTTQGGSCTTTSNGGGPGGAATPGGNGAPGGPGGGGAGGDSCAVVQGGGAIINTTNTALAVGSPGTGAGSAPNGTAAGVCF